MAEIYFIAVHLTSLTLRRGCFFLERHLWKAKQETKEELQKLFLSLEGELEEKGDK